MWLNYHHLLYFWTVAREGSIARASEVLRLAPSTISVQIKELEETLGEQLFERRGRQLVLTEGGHVALGYAEEIFSLGRELVDTITSGLQQRPTRISVGVSDVLPKLIVYQMLEPLMHMTDPTHLICQEGPVEQLLQRLAHHELDVVLTDAPMAPSVPIQAYNHQLGQSDVSLFATQTLVTRYPGTTPQRFMGAPFLMPGTKTSVRRALNAWLERHALRVHEAAEVDDRALMMVFAEKGVGFLAAPVVLADELLERHGLVEAAPLDAVRERFYAVTLERRIRHPLVDELTRRARARLGGE